MLDNFPRNRILRKNQVIRDLIAEHSILPQSLIYPIFICEFEDDAIEISSMKGIFRHTIHDAVKEIKKAKQLGIMSFMLFPYIPSSQKDDIGSLAINENNIICKAIKSIKDSHPDILLITDIALDPYTSHGHDGVLTQNYIDIDNDKTLEILQKQSIIQAKSGGDFMSPSDMMDGRVFAIRNALNENNFQNIGIISYSVKYSSSLYSPFRDAIGSGIKSGPVNKNTYQMDFRNSKIAIKSTLDDIKQGADAIIIKPASFYLDIIKSISSQINIPILAYQVSGEYVMIKNYSPDENIIKQLALESLVCIKRAGATSIISYFAMQIFE